MDELYSKGSMYDVLWPLSTLLLHEVCCESLVCVCTL